MAFDIERDVSFPLRDDDRIEKLLIGTLLTLFSGLLVPLLPVYGYLLSVARSGMAERDQLPAFTDWESLFVEGIKSIVIVVAYQLPPLVISLVSVGALVALGSQGETLGLVGWLVFALGLLLAAVVWVLLSYLAVVAVLTFADERELRAAFDVDLLRPVALDTDFLVNWLYGLGLVIGLNLVVGMALFVLQLIALIPIIGWIIAFLALFLIGPLGAAVSFYGQVVAFRVWGRGYAESRGPRPDVTEGAGSAPASPPETSDSTPADRTSDRDVDDGPTEPS